MVATSRRSIYVAFKLTDSAYAGFCSSANDIYVILKIT